MESTKKEVLIEKTLDYFLKYGTRNITMDDLAVQFGVSKKTLYSLFRNKEELLKESIALLWSNYLKEVNSILVSAKNPLIQLIETYSLAIEYVRAFDPIFLYTLKKYHQPVLAEYDCYKVHMRNNIILPLLEEAQEKGYIEQSINLDFFATINFDDLEEKLLAKDIFEKYANEEIMQYYIVLKLKGIVKIEFHTLF
ncbi:TetR/AcrR family transcriptional regulator [Flavobacterium chuncheonense]|uniref:TetR/AcrR family transcriptional regulator n=1 Tax=Flavobacterium chuncheonense TaxID=2026653 RepID=A0ABW5YNY9_9FLAO